VKRSKVSDVNRLADLFNEHASNLTEFLADGDRAQQVSKYLKSLAQHLSIEQTALLEELDGLLKNIGHINEIVAMQQSYARAIAVQAMESVPALVDDSLRVQGAALAESQVRVVRRIEPVPDILVDKHKVLQVLVNLISNARRSLEESTAAERVLTVALSLKSEDRIQISVTDNGVGIPPENLTLIFSHGYSTRDDGHGFGLHSGCLAAREMNGTLTAHSDGLGKGATFTLELPVVTEESAQVEQGAPVAPTA
jgi:signal transduction histidine kinase